MKKKKDKNRIVSVRKVWTDEAIQKAIDLYYAGKEKDRKLRMEC